MALKKRIVMSNGIPLEYHRIALITIDMNNQNLILVHSYLNEEARQYEKDYSAGLITGEPNFPYIHATYYNPSYDGAMSAQVAYQWLKFNVPEFEGAVDIVDDSEADNVTGEEFMSMLKGVL